MDIKEMRENIKKKEKKNSINTESQRTWQHKYHPIKLSSINLQMTFISLEKYNFILTSKIIYFCKELQRG
jgi:hypothetical protein